MFLDQLQNNLWSLVFFPLFCACGLRLMVHSRMLPYRRIGQCLRAASTGVAEKETAITPMQAASTALAATVGTGNVIGTAQAITMGGPGAVFWLWIAALIGMIVKYTEILMGLQYGEGAMGYIRAAMGERSAVIYAALAAISALFVGNMAQMNGAVSSLGRLFETNSGFIKLILGFVLTSLAGISILGGVGKVGRVTEILTPFMTIAYLLVTGSVLYIHRGLIWPALQSIFKEAFHPTALSGAAQGCMLRQSILWGLRRGSFSNEAGLGTAANIHSFSSAEDPVDHAFWGVFEVFADSILICSFTALSILCSGVQIQFGTLSGSELLERAIGTVYGDQASGIFISVSLVLFAMSTVIGCFLCASRCVNWFLYGHRECVFQFIYLLCSLVGCFLPLGFIWKTADAVNVLLAIPNLLSLLILAPEAGKLVRKRFREIEVSS